MSKKQQFIAYYRVSTDKQGRSGLGLDAQQEYVSRFLTSVGGELLAEYTEIESGKKHQNRPELQSALNECRRRKASLVIAVLDRLARNVHFISGLMESRVPFFVADMPHATPFEIYIRAAMAEEESRRISQRTKAALAVARRRGVKLGNPRLSEINAPRQKEADEFAVLMSSVIEELKQEGFTTYQAITDELNRRAVPTATGKGRWHIRTVYNLIGRIGSSTTRAVS